MQPSQPALSAEIETVAELRQLYRAAEARAARLRLMSAAGRQLALAETGSIDAVLAQCATQLAYFLGQRGASVRYDAGGHGLPIPAPGADAPVISRIDIVGVSALSDIEDEEDAAAVRLLLEMMGGTLDRINRDRERMQLFTQLRDREARLEKLVGQVLTVQEEERRRVSHELHDGVAQAATALMRMLEGENATAPDVMPGADRTRLASMARALVQELRDVIRGLRPTILDDLGLAAGLRSLAEAMEADGYRVIFFMTENVSSWSPQEETVLYRVAQEALANIRNHAGGPCDVAIILKAAAKPSMCSLSISNTGGGGAVHGKNASNGHFGIDIMRERMASLGGTLHWTMESDGGVTVLAQWPFHGGEGGAA